MKRLLLALVLAPQLLLAQRMTYDTLYIAPTVEAITFCQNDGKTITPRTFIDEHVLNDTARLSEVRAHEAVHREDYVASHFELCKLRPRDVLRSEVRAYCVSDAYQVRRGVAPDVVYFRTLYVLALQFNGALDPHEVIAAWLLGCGKQMGITP